MTRDEFASLVAKSRKAQDELLLKKGADYTRKSEDVLANFKNVAAATGLSPLQVWAVYASKHWDAIMSYVQHGKVESEAIESRFADLENYLLLGEGLLADFEPRYWNTLTIVKATD